MPVKVKRPFSIWDDTSTQKPCVLELSKSIKGTKQKMMAAPQNTEDDAFNHIQAKQNV